MEKFQTLSQIGLPIMIDRDFDKGTRVVETKKGTFKYSQLGKSFQLYKFATGFDDVN
jgi:hypothetical protein